MPFEDGYFDRVIAIHVLEHLPDLPRALREISRLMKKDACVLCRLGHCRSNAF
jgi:ubiquinone/menaquinone biosynthesis C-methylase UbiE